MAEHVLVVDDEVWVTELIRAYLTQAGFRVSVASDGQSALTQFQTGRPDLVILDWMLPGVDGLEVAKRIRAQSQIPIIMLTARVDEGDRVAGLEQGADDYVTKPFSARELEARVRAVLRRAEGAVGRPVQLEVGRIRVDLAQHQAWVDGQPVELSPMEFDLLAFMMERPGKVFTRLELLEGVCGSTYESFERSIDSHIKRLRQKIEPDAKRPSFVLTVFGVGYKLSAEEKPR